VAKLGSEVGARADSNILIDRMFVYLAISVKLRHLEHETPLRFVRTKTMDERSQNIEADHDSSRTQSKNELGFVSHFISLSIHL
jgi:hypothetical protein